MSTHLCLILAISAVAGQPDDATKEQAVELARRTLGEERGVDPGALEVRRVEPREWPDAAMGCPEEGKAYAQVRTSGHRVLLRAAGAVYRVHVGGGRAVICDDAGSRGVPLRAGPDETIETAEVPAEVVEAARHATSKRLAVDPAALEIVRAEAVEWGTSLRCPGVSAAGAPPPSRAYLVVLRHGERDYEYRVARSASLIVCEGLGSGLGLTPEK